MKQNSYSYMTTRILVGAMIGSLIGFSIFLLWYLFAVEFCVAIWGFALRSTVGLIRILTTVTMVGMLGGFVAISVFLISGYNIHTIVVSDQSIELQRRKGSIIITQIENFIERNPNVLILEGMKPDGERISKHISAAHIGKKHWDSFKNDLRTYRQQQQQN